MVKDTSCLREPFLWAQSYTERAVNEILAGNETT